MLKKKVDELNFSMQEALKDPTISKAVSEAQTRIKGIEQIIQIVSQVLNMQKKLQMLN